MIAYRNWAIQSVGDSEPIYQILVFLLDEYSRLFGENIMFNETCIVYNEPQSECPMLITNVTPLSLRLSQTSTLFWAQTIYQLSHELAHYAMRQAKHNKNFTLSWFEEIVCEAMSLYALEYAYKHWNKCALASLCPTFDLSIKSYLDDEIKKIGNNEFHNCNSIEKLKIYEMYRLSESNRETQRTERNSIYNEILKCPEDIACILDYHKHVNTENDVVIDFDRWISNNSCALLQELKNIQPVKSYKINS